MMLYDDAKGKGQPRKERTKIINKLFQKDPATGSYQMKVNQPMFNEAKQLYERRYNVKKDKACVWEPAALMSPLPCIPIITPTTTPVSSIFNSPCPYLSPAKAPFPSPSPPPPQPITPGRLFQKL